MRLCISEVDLSFHVSWASFLCDTHGIVSMSRGHSFSVIYMIHGIDSMSQTVRLLGHCISGPTVANGVQHTVAFYLLSQTANNIFLLVVGEWPSSQVPLVPLSTAGASPNMPLYDTSWLACLDWIPLPMSEVFRRL